MIIIIIDIDECQDLKNRCSDNEECMNNEGGYSCPCKTGYQKLTDDLNEKCTGKLIYTISTTNLLSPIIPIKHGIFQKLKSVKPTIRTG